MEKLLDLADLLRLGSPCGWVKHQLLKTAGCVVGRADWPRRAACSGLDLMLGFYSDALLQCAAAQLLPMVRLPDSTANLIGFKRPLRGTRSPAGDLVQPFAARFQRDLLSATARSC